MLGWLVLALGAPTIILTLFKEEKKMKEDVSILIRLMNIYKRAGSTTVFQFTKSLWDNLSKAFKYQSCKETILLCWRRKMKTSVLRSHFITVACLSYSQNWRSKLNQTEFNKSLKTWYATSLWKFACYWRSYNIIHY